MGLLGGRVIWPVLACAPTPQDSAPQHDLVELCSDTEDNDGDGLTDGVNPVCETVPNCYGRDSSSPSFQYRIWNTWSGVTLNGERVLAGVNPMPYTMTFNSDNAFLLYPEQTQPWVLWRTP